jgi:hypothetical protein
MPFVPLLGGNYQGRSIAAASRRLAVNLYPEANPEDGQPLAPVTYYGTPGLRILTTSPNVENVRNAHRATNGNLYVVVGPSVYAISNTFVWTLLGSVVDGTTPLSFADNGLVIVAVDGSTTGYAIDMATNTFGKINDPNFLGARTVTQMDGFFIFERPGTNKFYISLSNVTYALLNSGTAFNPLDIAAKSSKADPIVSVSAIHGVLWLIGQLTTEIWAPSGAADFYFQRIPGAVINHGSAATYSLAQQDVSQFWLSQNDQGHGIVVKGEGDGIQRISTNAIESDIQTYANISDAIGFCHQVQGHSFYVLTLPSANMTWTYDLATGQWHRRTSIDVNGNRNRWRPNCFAAAYGYNIVGDYQNGNLYALDPATYIDNGFPIIREITFPHMSNNGQRVTYWQFQAKMEVGTIANTLVTGPSRASLSWSDDAGVTFGNPVLQSIGSTGQYLTSPQWQRLGMARDRIFKLSWDANAPVAIAGAWINTKVLRT